MLAKEILDQKGRRICSISENSDLLKAVDAMANEHIRLVLAVDEQGRLKGVVSERDMVQKVLYPRKDISTLKVRDVMTPRESLFTASENDDVQNLMNIMTAKKVRHIPVYNGDALSGVISTGDIIKSLLEAKEFEVKTLTDYISGNQY